MRGPSVRLLPQFLPDCGSAIADLHYHALELIDIDT